MTTDAQANYNQRSSLARLAAAQQLYGHMIQGTPFNAVFTVDCSHAWINSDPDEKLPCRQGFCRKLVTRAFRHQPIYEDRLRTSRHRIPEPMICSLLYIGLAENELRPDLKIAILVTEYIALCKAFCDDDDIPLFHALMDQCLLHPPQTGNTD